MLIDGNRMYLGGEFKSLNGLSLSNLAAVSLDTGEALVRLARDAGYARHVGLTYADPAPILR